MALSRKKASRLAHHLRSGRVYRRSELSNYSTAVDREIRDLIASGRLGKLTHGLYYVPIKSDLGLLPPLDEERVAAFLRTKDFLLFSPSTYNTVGLGTTQLYNTTWIYNRKRRGILKIGKRKYDFKIKSHFPKKLTAEFLFVDMINNLDKLAEDDNAVLMKARKKVKTMDMPKLQYAIKQYANVSTRKKFKEWIDG
jgi:hypothetical protein